MSGSKTYFIDLLLHVALLTLAVFLVVFPIYNKNRSANDSFFYTKPNGLLGDYYYYLSVINQGKIQFFEIDPYTTEKTNPGYLHIYYLFLGKVSNLFNISVIETYYLGLASSFLVYYFYVSRLVSMLFSKFAKWGAMAIIFLSGPFPLHKFILLERTFYIGESWWTKMDVYSRLTHVPHHMLSMGLMVGSVYFLFKYQKLRRKIYLYLCSITVFLGTLVFVIPGFIFMLSLISVACVQIIRTLIQREKIYPLLKPYLYIFAGFVIPFVFTYFQLTRLGFPWTANISFENLLRPESYPILLSLYISGFSICLPFIIITFLSIIKKFSYQNTFLFFLFVNPIICYILAVNNLFQVNKLRFVYAAPYLVGGLLACAGIKKLLSLLSRPIYQKIFIVLITVIFSVNIIHSLYIYWWPQAYGKSFYNNIYIHKSYIEVLNYLDSLPDVRKKLLSGFYTGIYIPAFSHSVVYIGHEASTMNYENKFMEVDVFFKGWMDPKQASEIINNSGVSYVFWDSCSYKNSPDSYTSLNLTKIFSNYCIDIYKTNNI